MKITLGELRQVIQEEALGLLSEEEEPDPEEEAEEEGEEKKPGQNEQNMSITLGQLRQIVREEYGNATSLREADDKEGNPAYDGAKTQQATIKAEIKRYLGAFRAVYERKLKMWESLEGKVKMNFVITAESGSVKDAKVTSSTWNADAANDGAGLSSSEAKEISDWLDDGLERRANKMTFKEKPTKADGDIEVVGYPLSFEGHSPHTRPRK